MLQLLRLSALAGIVYVSLVALGKTPAPVTIAALQDPFARACTATTDLQNAIDAVDYAEAVLIANGEMYFGKSATQIRADIAGLAAFDDTDGISEAEAKTLDTVLKYGRQLSYALATENLERQIDSQPQGIRVASADYAIDFEILDELRGGC